MRIIDISLSGAAIGTEQRPEIGSLVTIGKIPGRVVRHLEDGFAIEFTRLQHPDFVEENVDRTVNAALPFRPAGRRFRPRLSPPLPTAVTRSISRHRLNAARRRVRALTAAAAARMLNDTILFNSE